MENIDTMSLQNKYARLLIITHESIGERMSGPSIRAWEMAKALGEHGVNVILASPFKSNRQAKNVSIAYFSWEFPETIKKLIEETDIVMGTGPVIARVVLSLKSPIYKPVIVDIYYVPEIEEILLELKKPKYSFDPLPAYLNELFVYMRQGDLFIYAFDKQMDFWLGVLLAVGRLNKINLSQTLNVDHLFKKIPLGLPDNASKKNHIIKGSIPEISKEDKILYWGGGIWDWSNPLVLVKSLENIWLKEPNVKLVFGSMHHYDQTIVPKMEVVSEFMSFINTKDWLGKKIFFLEWVPYDNRYSLMMDVDIGLSIFDNSIESRFAARARLMDYLWAALPSIVTGDDEIGRLLTANGLAINVDAGDPNTISQAVISLLKKPINREVWLKEHSELINKYKWSEVVKPLLDFLKYPKIALDGTIARESLEFIIPLRKQWEQLRTEHDNEINRLLNEINVLKNRKVVKFADKYGAIRDSLLGKLKINKND